MKASDNPYTSILVTEGTEPTAPAAGKQRLYIDSTSHKLKRTDSSGVDVTIESTGGFTHAYEGYNTVGGSTASIDPDDIYTKAFTPGQNEMLLGVGAHLKWQEDYTWLMWAALFDNNAGSPGKMLAASTVGAAVALEGLDLHQATEVARWVHLPLTYYLSSGSIYYVSVALRRTDASGTAPLISYDTSGSDKTSARSNLVLTEGQPLTWTDSTRKYSIRADVIY